MRDIFTPEQRAKLIQNSVNRPENVMPVAWLRIPGTRMQWLVTELDADSRLFGLCDLGQGYPELGYVDLVEMLSIDPELPKPIVDPDFKPTKTLEQYTADAHAAGEIIL
jgi:hypothetical protein